jgi:hypothetical protein
MVQGENTAFCPHPESQKDNEDHVYGTVHYYEASHMRAIAVCGKQGRLFERRLSWWECIVARLAR